MEKKIILIDSDGVLANLAQHWVDVYNKAYDDTLTADELTATWDGLDKYVKPECGEKIYDFLKEPGFFQDCKPYDGAVETLEKMIADPKLECFIVTAYSGDAESAKGKVLFFKEYFPFLDTENIILCNPKQLVYGDVLIEDSYKKLCDWTGASYRQQLDTKPISLMIAQPHNQEFADASEITMRVPNLADAYEYIKSFVL